jgi:hypothetical protein
MIGIKVEDIVKINILIPYKLYDDIASVLPGMIKYQGEKAKVVLIDEEVNAFKLDIDNEVYWWTDSMVSKISS